MASLVGQTIPPFGVVTAATVIGGRTLNYPDGSVFQSKYMGDGTEVVIQDTRPAAVQQAVPVP